MRRSVSTIPLIAIGCHALLLVASVSIVYGVVGVSPWRELAGVVAAAPLAASLPGLVAQRPRALLWLSLLLVAYAGATVTEAVASAGGNVVAGVASLAAVVELGILPTLTRRRPSAPPADRE